jgi:ABC-type glycerol-3-phosphate transport system substrate-binding protein
VLFYIYKFTNVEGQIEWHMLLEDGKFPIVKSTNYDDIQNKLFEIAKDDLEKPADVKINKDVMYLNRPATLFIMESNVQHNNNNVVLLKNDLENKKE